MSAEWPEVALGSVTTWLSGGTPNKATPSFWNGNIPWISANSMYGTRFNDSDLRITESGLGAGSRLAPTNSVLLLVRGGALHNRLPVGMACRDLAFNQDVKALIADSNRLDPWFLLYWLIGNERFLLDEVVEETGIGAGKLDTKRMQALQMKLPPIASQKRIAGVARSIDDKIDLNRRINQTLEAMAQAIFKSWFVDFDPVKAKIAAIQEGRDPLRAAMGAISGKPEAELDTLLPKQYEQLAATAALFPDEMEESELGEIPRGWFVRAMPDCIDVNPSRTLKKGSVAQYLDMANVPTNSARAQNVVPREFTSGSKFRNGDTLLARITPCLENGKTAFVDFLGGEEVGWGSTEFIVLRPKNGLPDPFAYFLCRDPDFRAFAIAQMAGTSGRQRVPNDCFGSYKLVEPAEKVAIEFGRLASAVLNQIKALDEETKTLASLRNTLLPKLLSGELLVAEAMAETET